MGGSDRSKRGELFIVDNSHIAWNVKKYLAEWCELSNKFDIATGFFEIGLLLTLEQKWQNLEKIRILMGEEVSKRTRQAFDAGLRYITVFDVIGSAALVGSSSFTLPGITENIELNVQIKHEIETLQDWFKEHWNEAEDVTHAILKTVELHTREYSHLKFILPKTFYRYLYKGYTNIQNDQYRYPDKRKSNKSLQTSNHRGEQQIQDR